ncbi:MAG: DinB family protein, partial [Gemmatimonadota bacterium]|nr:DinB family protein [Gemmatimonadota bacterium]
MSKLLAGRLLPSGERLLEEALEAWGYTRRGVIAETENLPADDWDFRPEPGARSVAQLVRHVIESGEMMAGELLERT